MKLVFGVFLIMGGLCGAAMSFLSKIVVDSSLPIFNGLDVSMALGLFFIVVFLSGLLNLGSTS